MRSLLVSLLFILSGTAYAENNKLEFSVAPSSPVVIKADLTLNPGLENEQVIIGPWFRYALKVNNKSKHPITVIGLTFHVTYEIEGEEMTDVYTLNPADYGYSTVLEMGEGDTALSDGYYLDSLPWLKKGNYKVMVEVHGWYGWFDEPIEALNETFTFETR